jgi:hypothetical protein
MQPLLQVIIGGYSNFRGSLIIDFFQTLDNEYKLAQVRDLIHSLVNKPDNGIILFSRCRDKSEDKKDKITSVNFHAKSR